MIRWVLYSLRQRQSFKTVLAPGIGKRIECFFRREHRLIVIGIEIASDYNSPDNANFAEALSLTRAVRGQKDAAIKEAERAITLLPSGKDAVDGPNAEENLASVEVLVGDKNRAIPRLQHLLEIPYVDYLTPARLRLHPRWDPLRDDLRFQKLCEEKQP